MPVAASEEAREMALVAMIGNLTYGGDLEAGQHTAGLLLDVAGGAAQHGCPEVAREPYQQVIQTYIGFGYTAHRQRAEIGLADLRQASSQR